MVISFELLVKLKKNMSKYFADDLARNDHKRQMLNQQAWDHFQDITSQAS